MGIDDISGKAAAFWVKAKSALTGNLPETPNSAPAPSKPAGDSVDLPNRGQYFAGYAFPASGDAATPSTQPGVAGADALTSGATEPGNPDEPKVWAPLVIAPFENPQDS
jgi:hypothetical protein